MSESIQIAEKDKFDTREKLEADVMNFCERFYTTERRYNELIKLLDRQAAIARAECQKYSENVADWEDSCDTREELEYDCKWMAYAWSPDVFPDDKLEKKLYREIIEKLDRQKEITERECRKPNWDYCETCELQDKVDSLEAENAALREKLSKALDHAHSISKLGELD